MILRNRIINAEADEVRLSVSYSQADVRRLTRRFVEFFCPRYKGDILETAWPEKTFRDIVEHWGDGFAVYEQPWRSQLSQWWFRSMIKQGFVIQSATDQNLWLVSQKALDLTPKSREWRDLD